MPKTSFRERAAEVAERHSWKPWLGLAAPWGAAFMEMQIFEAHRRYSLTIAARYPLFVLDQSILRSHEFAETAYRSDGGLITEPLVCGDEAANASP